ncbi:MAG: sortase domain-containing protein [Natronosporangium sp.]
MFPGSRPQSATRRRPGEPAITRQDETIAQFEVTQVEQYPKREFPTTRVYGNTTGPELRLITCSGEYDPDTRSFQDNTVVYAELTTRIW